MSDRMPAHVREAAERMIREADDDEVQALLGAFDAAHEGTTVLDLLTDFFTRLGNTPEKAAEAAQEAIAAGPLNFRTKLN